MGNYISTDLNKIVINEEPILFMRNKTKSCRILDVKPNNEYQIAFFSKKNYLKCYSK